VIVLDTNVLSELMRPAPEAGVVAWIGRQPPASLFTTTLTQAEVLYGVGLLTEGRRKRALEEAASGLFDEDLAGKLLPFDVAATHACAAIAVARRQAREPLSQFDAQIVGI
jgi:predicted nucleic acid-binding protein